MVKALRKRIDTGDQSGFTLIELLIVIAILGILAGIVVFAVGTAKSDATTAACDASKATVSTAAEAYKAKNGAYPVDLAAMVPAFMKTAPAGTYAAGTGTLTACT
jgi:general secretion pathway protein G